MHLHLTEAFLSIIVFSCYAFRPCKHVVTSHRTSAQLEKEFEELRRERRSRMELKRNVLTVQHDADEDKEVRDVILR